MITDIIPGYNHFFKKAIESDVIYGGISLVAPNGKYLFIKIQLNPELIRQCILAKDISPVRDTLYHASFDLSQNLEKLK